MTQSTIHNRMGFTIVELLIVIVVIAILAAITIVSYNGIQNRTYDTAVQNDLSQFGKKMEMVRTDSTTDTYPGSLNASMGFRFTKDVYSLDTQLYTIRYCLNASANKFVLFSRSKSGNYFKYISGEGVSSNPGTYGFGVCELVGLTSVNPQTNGLNNTTWNGWTNN